MYLEQNNLGPGTDVEHEQTRNIFLQTESLTKLKKSPGNLEPTNTTKLN